MTTLNIEIRCCVFKMMNLLTTLYLPDNLLGGFEKIEIGTDD